MRSPTPSCGKSSRSPPRPSPSVPPPVARPSSGTTGTTPPTRLSIPRPSPTRKGHQDPPCPQGRLHPQWQPHPRRRALPHTPSGRKARQPDRLQLLIGKGRRSAADQPADCRPEVAHIDPKRVDNGPSSDRMVYVIGGGQGGCHARHRQGGKHHECPDRESHPGDTASPG